MGCDKWIVLSTRSKDLICGAVWSEVLGSGKAKREVYDNEQQLLDAVDEVSEEWSRVIIDANLRRMGKDVVRLSRLQNLVIFDHDICQQYCSDSDWYKTYFPVLKRIGARRVIVSSQALKRDLLEQGVDAEYLPKAYDAEKVSFQGCDRSVFAGFVGRTNNKVYRRRKRLLEMARRKGGVQLVRASPGEEYNSVLNSIAVFVSADVGFKEYMIKNFEAMAAGCLLLAWRQPDGEQEALGFEEGKNVLLYDSQSELLEKLRNIESNPELYARIAEEGRVLVEQRHNWVERSREIVTLLDKPLTKSVPGLSFMDRLRLLGKI